MGWRGVVQVKKRRGKGGTEAMIKKSLPPTSPLPSTPHLKHGVAQFRTLLHLVTALENAHTRPALQRAEGRK